MISSNAKSRLLKMLFRFMKMKGQAISDDGGLSSKDKKPGETSKTMDPRFNGKWFECLTVK
jgi:hypothetical protein